jgi:hypothetical protein
VRFNTQSTTFSTPPATKLHRPNGGIRRCLLVGAEVGAAHERICGGGRRRGSGSSCDPQSQRQRGLGRERHHRFPSRRPHRPNGDMRRCLLVRADVGAARERICGGGGMGAAVGAAVGKEVGAAVGAAVGFPQKARPPDYHKHRNRERFSPTVAPWQRKREAKFGSPRSKLCRLARASQAN